MNLVETKKIIEETMEVFYNRDRTVTDNLFRDIQNKQNEMSEKQRELSEMILSFDSFLKQILNKLS